MIYRRAITSANSGWLVPVDNHFNIRWALKTQDRQNMLHTSEDFDTTAVQHYELDYRSRSLFGPRLKGKIMLCRIDREI